MKKLLFVTVLVGMTLVSCKKEINDNPAPVTPGDVYPMPLASPVSGSLSGKVLNENGQPVTGATVVCVGRTTTTDNNGIGL